MDRTTVSPRERDFLTGVICAIANEVLTFLIAPSIPKISNLQGAAIMFLQIGLCVAVLRCWMPIKTEASPSEPSPRS